MSTSAELSERKASAKAELAAVRAAVDAADDVPTSMKLLIHQGEARHNDMMAGLAAGFDSNNGAIRNQTKALGVIAGGAFALVTFMVAGFMYLAKVDLDATLRATNGIVEAAGSAGSVAPHGTTSSSTTIVTETTTEPPAVLPAAEQPTNTAGADHNSDAPPSATTIPPAGE